MTTFAPSLAAARTIAAPMPLLPPVTTMTLFSSSTAPPSLLKLLRECNCFAGCCAAPGSPLGRTAPVVGLGGAACRHPSAHLPSDREHRRVGDVACGQQGEGPG